MLLYGWHRLRCIHVFNRTIKRVIVCERRLTPSMISTLTLWWYICMISDGRGCFCLFIRNWFLQPLICGCLCLPLEVFGTRDLSPQEQNREVNTALINCIPVSVYMYGGTSIILTPLGPYQAVLIIEVLLVWRLVDKPHSSISGAHLHQISKRRPKGEGDISISSILVS